MSTDKAWLPDEKVMYINVLELKKPILLASKSFVKTSHKHIKIMPDNKTAINYINKLRISHCMECHHHVLKIWKWAIIHKNHLSAAHIPGKLNTVADKEERLCFKPEIHVFAENIIQHLGQIQGQCT